MFLTSTCAIKPVIKLSSNSIFTIFQSTWKILDIKKSKRLKEMLWKSFSSFMLDLEKVNVGLKYVMKIGSSNKL